MAIASSLGNGLSYKILISVVFCYIFTWTSVVLTGLDKHLPVLFPTEPSMKWGLQIQLSYHCRVSGARSLELLLLLYILSYSTGHSFHFLFYSHMVAVTTCIVVATHSLWWSYLYHLFNMLSALVIDLNTGGCSVAQKDTGSSGKFKSKWFRDSILHLLEG